MTTLPGGDLVAKTLAAAGVDTVFGILSVHNIPIYDAIGRLGGIRPVPVRQEASAILAADGYARATGKLGVAITSTGPGAGNAMGSMVESHWAASPVLHLTGNVDSRFMGKGKGFIHEARNQLGMLEACSKWAVRPSKTAEIPDVLTEAIRQATTGRRGPVSVELPIDLQYFDAEAAIPTVDACPRPQPDPSDLERAADLIAAAQRPLIWAGGGVITADASPELTALAHRLGAGVVTSLTGRGSIPEDDDLCLGSLTWEKPIQDLLKEADLLLAVGTRFQGPNTQNWQLQIPSTLVHIDVEADEIGRNYPATAGIVADAKPALAGLLARLSHTLQVEPSWRERVVETRAAGRAGIRERIGQYGRIMDDMRDLVPRESVVVKDATIPAYTWANRILDVYEPRTTINSASLAIGVGLPLAIGAAIGRPNEPVILIAGDGGFAYSIGELATAMQERLPIVALIFNDRGYGILRNIQDGQFEGRRMASVDLHTPDFVKLADSYGVWSKRVASVEEFGPALGEALRSGGPSLLDIDCDAIGPMPVKYGGTSRRPVRS
ncbi:MAG: thiamine pyrophosphate-binding protein [Chloroflexi bacterium]|nr:thiamine pyrophosphate-binding protein [Chloroflexota bacterium]